MTKVYIICMCIGLIFPFISLVMDVFDSVFDAISLDIDFFDVDIGDFSINFLPISFLPLCLISLLFGGINLALINTGLPFLGRNILAGGIAYVSGVALQTGIKYLKGHTIEAEDIDSLLMRECFVCNKITENGYGSVNCQLKGSSDITITAKSADGKEILQDTKVKILSIENNVAIVEPANMLEQKYK